VIWECGQRDRASELFVEASKEGVYPQSDRKLGKIDLHHLSKGAALASLTRWLDVMAAAARDDPAGLPDALTVMMGKGSRRTGESEVKAAVTALLAELGSPFEAPSDSPGHLEAKRAAVDGWIRSVGSIAPNPPNHVHPLSVQAMCGDNPPS
jgi:hypothetical protein